jgi:hypothetical protein
LSEEGCHACLHVWWISCLKPLQLTTIAITLQALPTMFGLMKRAGRKTHLVSNCSDQINFMTMPSLSRIILKCKN